MIWIGILIVLGMGYVGGGLGTILGLEIGKKRKKVDLNWPDGRIKGYLGCIIAWPYIFYKLLTAKGSSSTIDES